MSAEANSASGIDRSNPRTVSSSRDCRLAPADVSGHRVTWRGESPEILTDSNSYRSRAAGAEHDESAPVAVLNSEEEEEPSSDFVRSLYYVPDHAELNEGSPRDVEVISIASSHDGKSPGSGGASRNEKRRRNLTESSSDW